MKREEPVIMVNKRLELLVTGIILLLAGIAGVVCAFTVEAVRPYQILAVAVSVVAAVIGLVLLLIRNISVGRDERSAKQQRLAQLEEDKKLRQPVQEIQKTMEEASEEAARVEERAMVFLGQYHIFSGASDARSGIFALRSQIRDYERLKARVEKSKEVREEYDSTKKELLAFGKELGVDFGEDISTGLSRMQMRAAEYRLAQEACALAEQKKDNFERENKIGELAAIEKCPYSLDELNAMIFDVDDRMEDVREVIEQYNHQMEDLQEQLDARDEKEQQLANCREEQMQESHLYDVLSLTRDFLQTAKEQFSARYLGPIESGFGKYYELLTGDHSRDWMVDANISVKMKEQGQLRETKWLSAGYQDLLGICMRFALVDAMYPTEKPFLVLDDPFVNLDEDKMAQGTKLLKQISREYQILYFTCHESREML
jgi:uncharacterized protein YhaN